MLFGETFTRQPRWLVLIEAFASVLLIGWLDYLTGREWSFFLFYAFPILIVVRSMGRRVGFGFAFLCAAVWLFANLVENRYETFWGFALAVFTRLFFFGVFVVAVAAVTEREEADKAKILVLERARELEGEILRVSENEHRRIGQDLHDGLGPHLAAIGYAATFLADELRKHERPETNQAEQIREMAAKALSLTRGLARGIFPVQMDATGLSAALEDLARTTSRLTETTVSFFEEGDTAIEDPETAMHLFRIAQEAVNNALRHGDAKRITIALRRGENALSLVVADDGKGMDLLQRSVGSIGLRSMKYRARAVGAELKIESKPNDGTVVSCELPIIPSRSEKPPL